MKKRLLVAAVAALSVLGLSAPAMAAGQLCYDVQVNINGTPQGQAGCIDLPV